MPAGCRRIRWGLVVAGAGLMLFFWLADAFFDARASAGGSFADRLFHPEAGELLINLIVYSMLLALISHAWRKADSLDDTLAAQAAEKTRTDAILAAIPDAVTVQDTDYRILYQSPTMKAAKGDCVGEFCYHAYHGREEVCPGCDLFADGLPSHREFSDCEPPRYFEAVSAPLYDAEGVLVAGIETVRDVTARRHAELQLRQQLEAIEASMDGIAILNPAGEYLYLNRAHAATYGYPDPEELLGQSWHILYPPEERQRLEPLIEAGFARSGGWRGEASGLKRDGSRFPQEISLTALEDGGTICVVRDISDRRLAEEQIRALNTSLTRQTLDLQASNRDLEAFGYSLAHDLRSPLAVISLAAQNCHDLCAGQMNATGGMLIDSILHGCDKMEKLIEAMQELFKVSRSELAPEPVDLSGLAAEILADLQLGHPDRRVRWHIAPGLAASCDPQLIRILLENLLGNAWKYSAGQDPAHIEVGRETVGNRAFFIRDDGAGFDMREAGRLFQPFQRLHPSAEFPGSGIGLATVQRIIDRHAGTIRAAGECGKGATFSFTLPAADPVPPPGG